MMPHGNYDGCYPRPSQSRDEVIESFGLSPRTDTLTLVGSLRANKGIDVAIEALAGLPDVQLIIAGEPIDVDLPTVREQLRRAPN